MAQIKFVMFVMNIGIHSRNYYKNLQSDFAIVINTSYNHTFL